MSTDPRPLAERLAARAATLARDPHAPREAPSDSPALAEGLALADPAARLAWVDLRLATAGFPAMGSWWRDDLSRFYASGKTWGLYLVGRGGGKSTTLTRVSLAEGLFAPRVIPPGQRWIWPFVSVSSLDARRRITEIGAMLGALGIGVEVSYVGGHPTIETTDARGNAIAWTALASTIAAVSGPSAIGATVDEEAKLRDRNTNANPAREVLASLVQTFRARPEVRGIRCSSAFGGLEGSHAAAVREGDTAATYVARVGGAEHVETVRRGYLDVATWEAARGRPAEAADLRSLADHVNANTRSIPTWLANPTISAIASREAVEAIPSTALEGLTRTGYWLRENASVIRDGSKQARSADLWRGLKELNSRIPPMPFYLPGDEGLVGYDEDTGRRYHARADRYRA